MDSLPVQTSLPLIKYWLHQLHPDWERRPVASVEEWLESTVGGAVAGDETAAIEDATATATGDVASADHDRSAGSTSPPPPDTCRIRVNDKLYDSYIELMPYMERLVETGSQLYPDPEGLREGFVPVHEGGDIPFFGAVNRALRPADLPLPVLFRTGPVPQYLGDLFFLVSGDDLRTYRRVCRTIDLLEVLREWEDITGDHRTGILQQYLVRMRLWRKYEQFVRLSDRTWFYVISGCLATTANTLAFLVLYSLIMGKAGVRRRIRGPLDIGDRDQMAEVTKIVLSKYPFNSKIRRLVFEAYQDCFGPGWYVSDDTMQYDSDDTMQYDSDDSDDIMQYDSDDSMQDDSADSLQDDSMRVFYNTGVIEWHHYLWHKPHESHMSSREICAILDREDDGRRSDREPESEPELPDGREPRTAEPEVPVAPAASDPSPTLQDPSEGPQASDQDEEVDWADPSEASQASDQEEGVDWVDFWLQIADPPPPRPLPPRPSSAKDSDLDMPDYSRFWTPRPSPTGSRVTEPLNDLSCIED